MKILIFGIVASGKTTLAKKLSGELRIPYYEGDCIAWGFPGESRYKRSNEEQAEIIRRIDAEKSWIVEGTYRESQKEFYNLAEKVIFLDTPLYLRKYRIIARYIKQKLGFEKCNYEPTLDMVKAMYGWTKEFEKDRKVHEERLLNYKEKVIHVRSARELEENTEWNNYRKNL